MAGEASKDWPQQICPIPKALSSFVQLDRLKSPPPGIKRLVARLAVCFGLATPELSGEGE